MKTSQYKLLTTLFLAMGYFLGCSTDPVFDGCSTKSIRDDLVINFRIQIKDGTLRRFPHIKKASTSWGTFDEVIKLKSKDECLYRLVDYIQIEQQNGLKEKVYYAMEMQLKDESKEPLQLLQMEYNGVRVSLL